MNYRFFCFHVKKSRLETRGCQDIKLRKLDFLPHIFLNAGNYCLTMEANGGSQYKAWQKSSPGENSTNTWINSSGTWELTNFDLTLKVFTAEAIEIVEDSIFIANSPIIPMGDNYGTVTIL